jgi:hypothetical protein
MRFYRKTTPKVIDGKVQRKNRWHPGPVVIPSSWRDSRAFWQRVSHFAVVTRPVHGRDLPFVVEPTRRDSVYACTVDDIATVLNAAPSRHVAGIEGVILRQPKRKEQILCSVWGRLGYAVEVGPI